MLQSYKANPQTTVNREVEILLEQSQWDMKVHETCQTKKTLPELEPGTSLVKAQILNH